MALTVNLQLNIVILQQPTAKSQYFESHQL